jgi:hypothetical protein
VASLGAAGALILLFFALSKLSVSNKNCLFSSPSKDNKPEIENSL